MVFRASQKRHHRQGLVTPLLFELGEIYSACINARWCSGFKALHPERHFTESLRQGYGRWITGAAAGMVFQPDMNLATEEGTRGENHAGCIEFEAHRGNNTAD